MLDFPVAPPVFVKDAPHKRKISTLNEARAYVDEMLHVSGSTALSTRTTRSRRSAHCASCWRSRI